MELSEKYIYRVYLARSFSNAAKTLYISQPSLSAAIANKEKELGFRIFDRTTKPISLTKEGEIYVEMLEEIMQCESNMSRRLNQLKKPSRKVISIGSTLYTSYYLLPTVCGAFYRRYPDIEVTFDVGNVNLGHTLFQKLDNKKLDILFSYKYDEKKHKIYPVFEEQVVLAMHKCFLKESLLPFVITRDELLEKSYLPEKEKIDVRLFRDIPFLEFSKNGSTTHYMSNILQHYSVSNYSILNVIHSGVHFNMMCAGVGAILTSTSAVRVSNFCTDDIVYFAFPKEISSRKIYAVLRKHDNVYEAVERFLDVVKEVCSSDESLSIYYK